MGPILLKRKYLNTHLYYMYITYKETQVHVFIRHRTEAGRSMKVNGWVEIIDSSFSFSFLLKKKLQRTGLLVFFFKNKV